MTIATGGESQTALDAACALELIHCYSLAHDDLPCMDNSDLRRGKAACHVKYNEAVALLAGDCLHSLAFAILAECNLSAAAVRILAHAAGAEGMGGGQMLDLQADAKDEPSLRKMHELKTGALFNGALQLGLLCRADSVDGEFLQKESRRLQEFAAPFGRLFQIMNDIRDAAADSELGKTTYFTVLGERGAKTLANEAREEAIRALGGEYARLADLTNWICKA